MKTIQLTLFFLFFFSISLLAQRSELTFLSGKNESSAVLWDFKINTGRQSGEWTPIAVPSNWETQGFGYYTYGRDYKNWKELPEIGEYRTHFRFSKRQDRVYRIVFQGSMTDTEVTLNGQIVGPVHQGGFTEFSYDITAYLKDGDNLLEVKVWKSSQNESVQKSERQADYWLFGGIFRAVYIESLPIEHIDRIASHAEMNGNLLVDVYHPSVKASDSIEVQVWDDTKQLCRFTKHIPVSQNQLTQLSTHVADIKPWSHEEPNLYRLIVQLKQQGRVEHEVEKRIGFRTFEVRDHDGFYLNGKRILLKGANRHSFRPDTARALSYEDHVEDIKRMKELNMNFVRCCHYPPDVSFLDLCDAMGLLVMVEITGWHAPLETQIGTQIVKETVIRDVNHPSVILWGNGNHRAYNPELEPVFYRWDIQGRRALRNEPRAAKMPSVVTPGHSAVDTRFYPSFEQLSERVKGENIVCPMECLHALYDGGGGAGLEEYWKLISESDVGGGLVFWAFYDESLVRTDLNQLMDSSGNAAPDGILGPNGEKEGSFYTIRKIWSPVQVAMERIEEGFDGKILVKNAFDQINLNQCRFEWELIHFTKPVESKSGHRTVRSGSLEGPDAEPGESVRIHIPLSEDWRQYDAMVLRAFDNKGSEVDSWCWNVAESEKLVNALFGENVSDTNLNENEILTRCGVQYSKKNGFNAIEELPFELMPFWVAATSDRIIESGTSGGQVSKMEGNRDGTVSINMTEVRGFDFLDWTFHQNGKIELHYKFTIPEDRYEYVGIGFSCFEESMMSKRWLGEGPARVWKNRLKGGTLDVWEMDKMSSIPAKVWNFPEFEGYFTNWHWAEFRFKDGSKIGFGNPDELYLGVLNPVNGEIPANAIWYYPEEDGLYLFHNISPVGAKWKLPPELGPQGNPTPSDGVFEGRVYLRIQWESNESAAQQWNVSIQ